MMNLGELTDLRRRLVIARANRQTFGAAEAYVAALEAQIPAIEFKGRRASVPHLLALVDAAIQNYYDEKLPKTINRARDFSHGDALHVSAKPPLRGHPEDVPKPDEVAYNAPPPVDAAPVAESVPPAPTHEVISEPEETRDPAPQPEPEKKPKAAPRRHRNVHGRPSKRNAEPTGE